MSERAGGKRTTDGTATEAERYRSLRRANERTVMDEGLSEINTVLTILKRDAELLTRDDGP